MATYLQWDYETSSVVAGPSNTPGETGVWLECYMPPPRTSDAQTLHWQLLEGTHGHYLHGSWQGSPDPLDRMATAEEINLLRQRFETAPIEVFGITIDCDDRSEKLMLDAIDTWDYRPVDGDWFADIDTPEGVVRILRWKDSNNDLHELKREELVALYQQMKINRAIRGQALWRAAQQFKQDGASIKIVGEMGNWLSPSQQF